MIVRLWKRSFLCSFNNFSFCNYHNYKILHYQMTLQWQNMYSNDSTVYNNEIVHIYMDMIYILANFRSNSCYFLYRIAGISAEINEWIGMRHCNVINTMYLSKNVCERNNNTANSNDFLFACAHGAFAMQRKKSIVKSNDVKHKYYEELARYL